jgi:hypothetical protein
MAKITCCAMYHCGSHRTDVILWFKNCWVLIIHAREKIRWISCARFPTTSKCCSGKVYRLCHVPLWLKSYICHFVTWNVSRWISCGRLPTTSKWSSGSDIGLQKPMSCIRIGSRTNERIMKKKDGGRKKNTKGKCLEKILPMKLIFSSYHGLPHAW